MAIDRKNIRRLRRYVRLRSILNDRHAVLIFLSFVVGVLASLANIVFRSTLHFIHETVLVGGREWLGTAEGGWHAWLLPLLPMVGAILIIPLARKYPGEVSGYQFYKFLETVNLKGGVLKARLIVIRILAPALTIGTGGSAGVEGPMATIGGTIGSTLGQAARASGSRMKLLIAAGSAGAIASAFNAPIAGIMFAMEIVLLGNYELTSFAAIVISSGIATVISRGYYGSNPSFTVPRYELVSMAEVPLYMVLGVLVGLLAVVYIRVFYGVKDSFERVSAPPMLKPVIGAFMVGVMGIFLPQVMADGYKVIESALAGQIGLGLLVLLVIFKILATSVTLGSGGAGGVFAPALFIGAMVGGAFGHVVHQLFPTVTATSGAYATVGIGAFLAAATHAPLTGIFLLFEMTGNYEIIVPVMFSAIIGTLLAGRLYHDSIDTVELTRKGIDIHAGREVSIMSSIKVGDVMRRDVLTVGQNMPLSHLVDLMIKSEAFYVPVMDRRDRMMGIVSIQDVRPVLFEEEVKGVVTAGQLATEKVISLSPEDDMNTAMEYLSEKDIEEIPVVIPSTGRVVGMLPRRDVITAYKKAVLKKERDHA
jgi:CIC family chloride channel protein